MIWPSVCLLAGAVVLCWPGRWRRRFTLPTIDRTALRERVAALPDRRLLLLVVGTAVSAGLLTGGPVAALIGAVYGTLGARAYLSRRTRARVTAQRAGTLDDLTALAADLRAGLPPVPPSGGDRRLVDLTAAVWRLAERTGAPAADLVDRVEADARAADRAAASAAAQAAGAQATALLLAVLPLGGIGLGYGIGVDPLRVLLHTPLGAACAGVAVLLQGGGLVWAGKLAGR